MKIFKTDLGYKQINFGYNAKWKDMRNEKFGYTKVIGNCLEENPEVFYV